MVDRETNTNLAETIRAPMKGAPTVCEIIAIFKSLTTKEYITGVKNLNWISFEKRLWQRNYYEHIIRDNESLSLIQDYIKTNPENWEKDKLFRDNSM